MFKNRSRAVQRSMAVAALATVGGLLATTVAGSASASAQVDEQTVWPAEVQEHLDAATRNAGGNQYLVDTYKVYSCEAVEDDTLYDRTSAQRKATRVPLTQIFDNVWYIGSQYVGQFIVKTANGGFMLIDTLNNGPEAIQYTLPALESLGLDAEHDLEGVLVSHGHGDHDGGANQLRATYGTDFPIYIGSGDTPGKTYSPTPIDTTTDEPTTFYVGGTKVVAQPATGHTPGTLQYFLPVLQDGAEHWMLVNGRQGHPAGPEKSKQYLKGTENAARTARELGITGTIHTHPTSDGSTKNMDEITAAGTRKDNPFIIGSDAALRASVIWRECAAAWAALQDPAADFPEWRFSTLTFPARKPQTKHLTATLATDWGPVAGQRVHFTGERPGTGCTAVTDRRGVASCKSPHTLRPKGQVTATFEGNTAQAYVNLPAEATTRVARK